MEIKEMQTQVDDWAKQFKEPYWPPLSVFARLAEEMGELGRELNFTFGSKPKKESDKGGSISAEIGDILVTLCCLANPLKIDLEDSFRKTMKKVHNRDTARFEKRN